MKGMNEMTAGIKRTVTVLIAVIMVLCVAVPSEMSYAVTKYKSKGTALAKYRAKDYKPVKNRKLKPLNIKSFHSYLGSPADMPHILGTSKGNKKIDLQTLFYLPNYIDDSKLGTVNLGNPQSLSITPDGNTAYVTHVKSGTKGFIIRYDLKTLREIGMNRPGLMEQLRYLGRLGDNYRDRVMACIKVGPLFKMGHGAAFSYNPKDKHLWFVTKTKQTKTDLWRINMNTLKPDLCINYTFDKKISFGNNLTFDKKGNIYQFQYSSSKQGKCPKDAIKIYQGKISLKGKKKVKFKLMRNVICYPLVAKHNVQSAGYDYKNNRIYMTSNSAVLSVPVSKLTKNKLKPKDVWMTQFNVKREFEDFEVDNKGNYYLLVNKFPEIMTNLVKWDGIDYTKFKDGLYIGDYDDGSEDDDENPAAAPSDGTSGDQNGTDGTSGDPNGTDGTAGDQDGTSGDPNGTADGGKN